MGQHGGGVPGGGAERMMTNQELILGVMRAQGKADALDLRARAPELDGTAIIAEEAKVPQFDGTKDYSSWAIGSPVWEEVNGERQVFTLSSPTTPATTPGAPRPIRRRCGRSDTPKTPPRQRSGLPPTAPAACTCLGSAAWTAAWYIDA